jgi:hypothetical protein
MVISRGGFQMDVEKGRVTFFGNDFGFIDSDSGGKVFFHLNDGRMVGGGKNSPKFLDVSPKRKPESYDRVVFFRRPGKKGPKACPWGFEDDSIDAQNGLTYRVLESCDSWGSPRKSNPKVIWEGSDISNLCREYPPSKKATSFRGRDTFDKLNSYSSDGFDINFFFEKKKGGGDWKECEDPREKVKR